MDKMHFDQQRNSKRYFKNIVRNLIKNYYLSSHFILFLKILSLKSHLYNLKQLIE